MNHHLMTYSFANEPSTESRSTSTSEPVPTCIPPLRNPSAWDAMYKFANDQLTMPQAIDALENLLGDQYSYNDWKPAFDSVFEAEYDTIKAIESVQSLANEAMKVKNTPGDNNTEKHTPTNIQQLTLLENELMVAIEDLKGRNRIHGTRLTLEDLLNPVEEQEIGPARYAFTGGDAEIIMTVKEKFTNEEKKQEEEEEEEEDSEKTEAEEDISFPEAMNMCKQLETLCVKHANAHGVRAMELQAQLRRFRFHLQKLNNLSHKQVTLDRFWIFKTNQRQ